MTWDEIEKFLNDLGILNSVGIDMQRGVDGDILLSLWSELGEDSSILMPMTASRRANDNLFKMEVLVAAGKLLRGED